MRGITKILKQSSNCIIDTYGFQYFVVVVVVDDEETFKVSVDN